MGKARLSHEEAAARIKAAKAAWRAKNAAYMKAYRESDLNKERIALQQKAWYEQHREEVLRRTSSWYEETKPKRLAYHADYYKKNTEKVKANIANWQKNNPHQVSAINQNRRARKKNCSGTMSADIVDKLLVLQRGLCACCRVDLKKSKFHRDHIFPLSLGGSNDDSNIQLLCPSCNCSKHSKHPVDFMQQRGYLL